MREPGIRSAVIAALLAIVAAGCEVLDPEDAAQEQILFISGGSLVERAPAARFFERPESPEARSFIRDELP